MSDADQAIHGTQTPEQTPDKPDDPPVEGGEDEAPAPASGG